MFTGCVQAQICRRNGLVARWRGLVWAHAGACWSLVNTPQVLQQQKDTQGEDERFGHMHRPAVWRELVQSDRMVAITEREGPGPRSCHATLPCAKNGVGQGQQTDQHTSRNNRGTTEVCCTTNQIICNCTTSQCHALCVMQPQLPDLTWGVDSMVEIGVLLGNEGCG